ncbi:DUF262 domain-containing protein [Cellulophaga sp. HaHa_2_95]|uniref:DUF262 domain-containing protein n=1 Tax=Cellulophaga sp. HaHa_2_95 TaxID=2745558 RepID=UPI001C4FA782|nr:DUF262 domain-containing protein [Cellulophaga sp. HaHa_2_95]QXP57152.1 DUF262 domain-containing protein [Cellulophaga sp. HaHa_2_95]
MSNNKLSFWELIQEFDKIEVPIIQRDYAQGRDTDDINTLRKKFVHDYLLDALIDNTPIELDFVYGSIVKEEVDETKKRLFVPLDGQQRLTTLYLLHYYLAVKEGKLKDINTELSKFTYETRPSAHDFCKKLIEFGDLKNLQNIKEEILDSVWFNYQWIDDPTVAGMLTMLETFSNHNKLNSYDKPLLPRLLDTNNKLITFYFTQLEEFGLTENLYIRMNARGKTLNNFENFKSEFFKIIQYDDKLLEEVKDKIEYKWVENLWGFKEKDSFLIDKPFLAYVSFITTMLYFKDAEFRSKNKYPSNFLDFELLGEIYSNHEHLKFLVFSLDTIENILKQDEPFLWNDNSLKDILSNILENKDDTNDKFIMYGLLQYNYQNKKQEHLIDYIRVVRNLIHNTPDNSRREWPRLIPSIENLIVDENIYVYLSTLTNLDVMQGFSMEQRKEEVYKAKIFQSFPDYKSKVIEIENCENFQGNITNILLVPFSSNEEDFGGFEVINYTKEKLDYLLSIFKAYNEILKNQFDEIWGDLIITSLYTQTYYQRLIHDLDYPKHPAILFFTKGYADAMGKLNLQQYLEQRHKDFVLDLCSEYDSFEEIREVKVQLYLYYIIQNRIYKTKSYTFFKNKNYNFGWLTKQKGYKSHYKNGIAGDDYFEDVNPIFQLYNQQFRYNQGINPSNTLEIEILGGGKKKNPFKLIKNWANN